MRKIVAFLAFIGLVAFSSCTGPEGAPGQDGQDGLLGTVYENQSPNYYNFTTANNFKVRFTFPKPIFDSDVVLVYRLGGVDSGKAIWEFLPETYYFADGTRDYSFNFNFTHTYVDIYLSGNDLVTVPDAVRLNQIFRIVIVPAEFAATVNKANYLEVVGKLNIKESQIQKVNF